MTTNEPRRRFLIARRLVRKEFQRDGAIELGVASLVDHTHPASPEFFNDFVVCDARAGSRLDIEKLPDLWT
jgi:hypothetical protein